MTLDRAGKNSLAIAAYQKYLKGHPASPLASTVYYRVAKNYVEVSDFDSALQWYQRLVSEFPRTDEEIHALLDMASLYQEKLKNPSKALEYDQLAFNRYLDNNEIKSAIQFLLDEQYQSATSLYAQRNYKGVSNSLDTLYKTYPFVFIPADTRAKIDSLADRARRAEAIAKASVDVMLLRSETPFNKSFDVDFPPNTDDGEKIIASPDGKSLAVATDDGCVSLWSVTDWQRRASFQAHSGVLWSLAFTPDGKRLATTGEGGAVRVWDADTPERHQELGRLDGHGRALAFSPDGQMLAAVGGSVGCPGELRCWDPATGKELAMFNGHDDVIYALVWTSTGELITGSADQTVRVWNPRRQELRMTIQIPAW